MLLFGPEAVLNTYSGEPEIPIRIHNDVQILSFLTFKPSGGLFQNVFEMSVRVSAPAAMLMRIVGDGDERCLGDASWPQQEGGVSPDVELYTSQACFHSLYSYRES